MNQARVVIAGGGMVAGYAAKQMVELGLKSGELAIVSADDSVPYERPPLSKGFLAGKDSEESIRISPETFYQEHGIALKLRSHISKVDAQRQRLLLESGQEFGFEMLIVATGARPKKLDTPGVENVQVRYLRSLDDSKAIRAAAEGVQNVIVIGGGFIGMEVAAVLAQKGITVTMVLREERIWKQFFTPRMSQFFEDYYLARGVRLLKSATIAEFKPGAAVLAGQTTLPCDLVVAGIGVTPVTDLLDGTGIEIGNGVIGNEYLETNQPGILAAGDVANYQDLLFARRRRVEHWDNAVSQGQYCGRRAMGEREPFRHVPYFFSDVFDLSYEFWGDPSDADEVVHRGELSTGKSFSVWWLREKTLVAAFVMNRPDEERESAPKWIENRSTLSTTNLANASKPLPLCHPA